jgi:DNA-directed RNA polymerase specialized sigma24 family protein
MRESTTAASDPELWSPAERDRLVRLCARLSGSMEAAEDLAQETLLEAWRARDQQYGDQWG